MYSLVGLRGTGASFRHFRGMLHANSDGSSSRVDVWCLVKP
jgi:hypothetical protein